MPPGKPLSPVASEWRKLETRSFVVLDTESFLHYSDNRRRLLALAFLVYDGASQTVTHRQPTVLVQWPADLTVDAESFDIHGITMERAAADGLEMHAVLELLAQGVADPKRTVLVGHGVHNDAVLLMNEAIWCGHSALASKLTEVVMVCTTLCMNYPCAIPGPVPTVFKWPNLTEAYQLAALHGFEVAAEEAGGCFHEAYWDTLCCFAVLRYLLCHHADAIA